MNEYIESTVIKNHYYELEKLSGISTDKFPNIIFLNQNINNDINRILNHIDVLITDYSSVFYDFLILNRLILFTPFDIDEYSKIDRELYDNYIDSVPGPICNDWNDVMLNLKKYYKNIDGYNNRRQEVFKEFFNFSDNYNSKRIINRINNLFDV